ncbi:uncharacterized protein TNCV_1341791 [Trichonephila clavipes]|uniref:Uncharacterized protein n=1 Tax=Trichonephila clavipes TaxID=2585209 RepID=A0A8X6S104_TRICX|nr:uncharacterized protein TNCV_1341791 [Trichonephila clavipes]
MTTREKQAEVQPEELVLCSRLPSMIKDKILEMEFVQSDAQMCDYLTLKRQLAKAMRNSIKYLEKELENRRNLPTTGQEQTQKIKDGLEAMKKELSTTVGEIALIFCPTVDCPSHTICKSESDSVMVEPDVKTNDKKLNPKQNSDKNKDKEKAPIKRPINNKNDKDNLKNSNKRTGQEDFKTPNKFARKIIEIPIEKVACTSQNKFSVLNVEEAMEVNSLLPPQK